jgi:Flp pilus assembly protein TadG
MTIAKAWRRTCAMVVALSRDISGIAATEFAFIVPLMLVMFFGVVEFSNGVAIDRKVTLMARTLSDLTSQSISVVDSDLTNFFAASNGIMTAYDATPVLSTITELFVDATLNARVQWSKSNGAGAAQHTVGSTVSLPTELKIANTYVIWSEISYTYVPVVGYVMSPTGVTMHDISYTRPRQSQCVLYNPPSPPPPCPTS